MRITNFKFTMTREEAKDRIKLLIDKFSSQIDYYKSLNYNETQTRQDFINPFFKALGWDIDNRKQQLETYRDVRHEDRIKVNGHTKAPDYSFNIEGKRKFFVEAKKPAIPIRENPEPALQVRNYGWNANLSISIVTDFEEFAIYDCTKKPKNIENANAKRLKYIYYTDYLKEFDFIYDTFSYESVLNNSIETYAKSKINFKTAEPVNKEFLKSLENWREYLATTIALRNNKLEEEEINFAVQQTIDRIVFLKVCEDRKIEKENNLFKLTKSGNLYQNLFQYFQIADQKYNSGLFDFKKDTITNNLEIDNKVIRNIITELYGKSKETETEYGYNFAIIPVEILGLAYEQFLGKVIRLTAAHHAKIEEKPEVRKAGGVYYTPEYIVEYIVKQTVGKLIERKTPEEISKIKILDPSCGSGSFLLGAYQFLLDYHLKYYDTNRSKLKLKDNPLTADGSLTSQEKKRILLNNIFGVDIDTQAVEVTKLSLLLKALEGETETSIQTSLKLFNERVLPTIDTNIQCGNSLIGTDFYNAELFLTPKEERKINVFDWHAGFPEIFKKGGFDCVIGNPPYGALFQKYETTYLLNSYNLQNYQLDSYFLFIEKSCRCLIENGLLGYIIPNTWLLNLTTSKIRDYIFKNVSIETIINYKAKVFEQAVVDTQIILFKNRKPETTQKIRIDIVEKNNSVSTHSANQNDWIIQNGHPINIFEKNEYQSLKSKISIHKLLDDICKITQGTKPFQVGKGVPKQTREIVTSKPFVSKTKFDESFRPLLRGSLMNKFAILWNENYWIKFGDWLAEPRYSASYDIKEKIIIRQTGDSLIATLDTEQFIVRDNLYTIVSKAENYDLKYILGIINSKLMNWYYQNILNNEKGEALAQVKRGHIAQLPIKEIDFANKIEINSHNEIVKIVDNLLSLYKRINTSNLETEKQQLIRRIKSSELELNNSVFRLYSIDDVEKQIIER